MQRKAFKQLGKVTQWTNEKVFSGDKTQFSAEFSAFEDEIEPRRRGVERLHATSLPFYHQVTKRKPTEDPYPSGGSSKDKILHTEALGLVMADYGGDVRSDYGDALGQYGRARSQLASAQEEFGQRMGDVYIAGMEQALTVVNEYKSMRKKLDSRRLTLDAAITRAQTSKKDQTMLQEEVEMARLRFEEIEEEARDRMNQIQELEAGQFAELTDLLEAELEFFAKCHTIMEELKEGWPSGSRLSTTTTRPRAGTTNSTRSLGRNVGRRGSDGSDEDVPTPNRSRAHSSASATAKETKRRSMLPSFGAFGRKSGAMASAAGTAAKKKAFGGGKERNGYSDDRRALASDDDDDSGFTGRSTVSPVQSFGASGRTRSQSTLSASHLSVNSDAISQPPPFRRAMTNPLATVYYVKAMYDFAGGAEDELPLQAGQIIEVKKKVDDEWWIGESGSQSGLFPRAYTEDYVPTPTNAGIGLPARRVMPPPAAANGGARRTMPPALDGSSTLEPPTDVAPPRISMDTLSDRSEVSAFDDGDHYATASLAAAAAPTPAARFAKKAAPPPPPMSRRTQSSNNILSSTASSPPPPPPTSRGRASTLTQRFRLESSPEGSPFAGSEDDEADAQDQAALRRGLHGDLRDLHIGRQGREEAW